MKAVVNYILNNRYGLSVFFLAAIFLLPFLGMFPLIDPDEPVYGQTAREMLAPATGCRLAFTAISGMISRLCFIGWK